MRSASLILASALLFAVLAAPNAAAQDPTCNDSYCFALCDSDPCIEPRVEVGPDGATVGYVHHMGLGGAGGVHTGPDGTYVYYGEGISGCQVGTNGMHCVY